MPNDIKAPNLDFGALIAFVAPGFVGLLAVGYQLPAAGALVAEASKAEQNVGIFLFGFLASLAIGLAVSGLRSLIIDIAVDFVLEKFSQLKDPDIPWKTFDIQSLAKLLVLRDNFYRYYQFYSNMAVAMILWAGSRTFSTLPEVPRLSGLQWGLIFIGVVVLLLAAGRQLKEYYRAKNVLAGV